MGNFIDLTGQRFGILTVIKLSHKEKAGVYVWLCRCECGRESYPRGSNLRSGNTLSCGCRKEQARVELQRNSVKHGKVQTRVYQIYHGMMTRCYNRNSADYALYGGRGIKVCERWKGEQGFENFCADMGDAPDGLSIDRRNNNGDYEPQNCYWASNHQQARNKRNNRKVTWRGETKCLTDWAKLAGKPASWLHKRLARLSLDDAMKPVFNSVLE